jgi:hypothetical protein
MRNLTLLLPFVCLRVLGACSDDSPPSIPKQPPPEPKTISIASTVEPTLVAFRDGADANWQVATKMSATSFQAVIHGPYVVTVVCEDRSDGDTWVTWQAARTPDDPTTLSAPCDVPATKHTVTVHMVQAGRVQLGSSTDVKTEANQDYHLSVPSGSYDLIAVAGDRVLVRRGEAVDGDVTLAPVDVAAAAGATLVDVDFTADEIAKDEELVAEVGLATTTTGPASLFVSDGVKEPLMEPVVTAKLAPDSLLDASDTQTITLRAINGNSSRALRRVFKADDDPTIELPTAVDSVVWTLDGGRLSMITSSVNTDADIHAFAEGASGDSPRRARHDMEVSSAFMAATGIVRFVLDNNIPGYQPAWKIDLASEYTRSFHAEVTTEDDEVLTNDATETVNGPATSQ